MKIILIQAQGFINGSGGTEKICTFLANNLSKSHQVTIATNENIQGEAIFPLDSSIDVVNIFDPQIKLIEQAVVKKYRGKNILKWLEYKLAKKRAKQEYKNKKGKMDVDTLYTYNLRLKSQCWKRFIDDRAPDLIITMSIGSLLELSYENEYVMPIIDSVNGRPDYDYTDILWYRSPIDMECLKQCYAKLSGIQVLFDSYKEFLPSTFSGLCRTIANPVPQLYEGDLVKHADNRSKYTISSIASLVVSCKQQDMAIRVFAKLAAKYPDWHLEFWGVGYDQGLLSNLIKSLNMSGRISLKGFTDKPLDKLKESDVFIFPSKYEGFPLALTEAMSVGLPCLGLSSCSGVNELIKDGLNGYLCADEAEMVVKLDKLMSSAEVRAGLGEKAHCDMQSYCPDLLIGKWTKFIEEIVEK